MQMHVYSFVTLSIVVLSLVNETHAQFIDTVCLRECIPLSDCPSLLQFLPNPSRSNTRRLRKATCSVRNRDLEPMVCCDEAVTARPPQPRPSPVIQPLTSPAPDLLPRECGRVFRSAIVGGVEASLESNIWLALLGYTVPPDTKTQFLCTGSLINERYVVTAAHCVDPELLKPKQHSLQVIRVGEKDLLSDSNCNGGSLRCAPPSQDFAPASFITHPRYDSKTLANDIALVRLDSPVDFNAFLGYVGPVCLSPPSITVSELADRLVAVNWGLTDDTNRFLHRYDVNVFDTKACNETFNGLLVDGQICVTATDNTACIGDGGSPLVATGRNDQWQILGVLTYGFGCASSHVPSVFTSVHFYRNWIQQVIEP